MMTARFQTTIDGAGMSNGSPPDSSSTDTGSAADSGHVMSNNIRFIDACLDGDDDALYEIIQDGVGWAEVNERDKSGRVSGDCWRFGV